MIIHEDKKGTTTAILAKRDKDGNKLSEAPMKADVVKDEDGVVDGRHEAAQDIMAAIHEKSPMKLMEALKNFHDLHQMMSKADADKE